MNRMNLIIMIISLLSLLGAIYGLTIFLGYISIYITHYLRNRRASSGLVLNLEKISVEDATELMMIKPVIGNIYYQKDIDKFLKNVTGNNGSMSDWVVIGEVTYSGLV